MNYYKKLTQKLLEQYPLLWHSKAIQMWVIGIGVNIFSFLVGFGITDISIFKKFEISNYFFDSGYGYFFAILCLVIIVIWGLTYFKNNAIKKFYPSSDFYIAKLYLLIFSVVLLFSLNIPSFYYGVQSKIKSIVSKEVMENEVNQINLAAPFLALSGSSDYLFDQRSFPKEYLDLNYVNIRHLDSEKMFQTNLNSSYDNSYVAEAATAVVDEATVSSNENTRNMYSSKVNHSNFNGDRIFKKIKDKSGNWVQIFNQDFYRYGAKHSYVDGDTIIIYRYTSSLDSCNNEIIWIDSFLEIKDLPDFKNHSIENYQSSLISENINSNESDINKKSNFNFLDYDSAFTPIVHNWVKTNNKAKIIESLDSVQEICKKYNVEFFIITPELVSSWESNNYKTYNIDFLENSYETAKNKEKRNNKLPFYLNTDELKNVYDNIQAAYSSNFFKLNIEFFFIFALILAAIIVFFEFAELKLFLISVVAANILSIIVGVISAFLYSEFNSSILGSTIILIFIALIFILIFIGLHSHTINKPITTILYYIGYAAIIPFVISLVTILKDLSGYTIQECGHNSIKYHIDLSDKTIVTIICLALYLLYTLLVKKLLAKEE